MPWAPQVNRVTIQSNLTRLPDSVPRYYTNDPYGRHKVVKHGHSGLKQVPPRPRGYYGYNVSVNDIDVTRREEGMWDTASTYTDNPHLPKTMFRQVKQTLQSSKENFGNLLHQSRQGFSEVLHLPQHSTDKVLLRKKSHGDLRKLSKKQAENPEVNRLATTHGSPSIGRLRQSASMFIEKHKTLNNISQFVSHRFEHPSNDATIHQPSMSPEKKESIGIWIENAHEGEENPTVPNAFDVVTTEELSKIGGKNINSVRDLHRYRGPPPSLADEMDDAERQREIDEARREEHARQAGFVDGQGEVTRSQAEFFGIGEGMFTKDNEELDLIDELEEEQTYRPVKRKDLVKFFGTTDDTGLRIIKAAMTSYRHPTNLSDYYKMPLLLPEDFAFQEHQDIDLPDTHSINEYDLTEIREAVLNFNFIPPPNHLKPAHSLVLYLTSHGYDPAKIADNLKLIDPDFLNNASGRVYKGIYIPDYLDMDDTILPQLQKHDVTHFLDWEKPGFHLSNGQPISSCYLAELDSQRDYCAHKFARYVVENYVYYRMTKGRIPHRKIKLGETSQG